MGCSFRPDWVAGFLRIRWQLCTGLGGRNHRNTQPSSYRWNTQCVLGGWKGTSSMLGRARRVHAVPGPVAPVCVAVRSAEVRALADVPEVMMGVRSITCDVNTSPSSGSPDLSYVRAPVSASL